MTPSITTGVDMVRVASTGLVVIAPLSVVMATWLRAVAGDRGQSVLRVIFTALSVAALAAVGSLITWFALKGYATSWLGLLLIVWYALTSLKAASHTNTGYALLTSEKRPRKYGAQLLAMPAPKRS